MLRFLLVLLISMLHIGSAALMAFLMDDYFHWVIRLRMPAIGSLLIVGSLLLWQCFNIWFFSKYIKLLDEPKAVAV